MKIANLFTGVPVNCLTLLTNRDMSQNMLACLDTVMRMIVYGDAHDDGLPVQHDISSGGLPYSLSTVSDSRFSNAL